MSSTSLETIYETLLSVPGMNDLVKIDLKIPRKTVLLFTEVLAHGMLQNATQEKGGKKISKESEEELNIIISESLEKAGLTELSAKLKALSNQD